MPEKIFEPKLPRGLPRIIFRFPIGLYHAHLGWIMGHRFLLLTHTGRKSGLPRQNVLEVVRYDKNSGACVVASGWGVNSDWVINIIANPRINYQVQNQMMIGIAERLSPDEGAQELLEYARNHRLAFRELCRFMGYRTDGSDEDICAMGHILPIFVLNPHQDRKDC